MTSTQELRGVPLLREVLKTIDEKPELWDQTVWGTHCGTAMCVAGWACTLAGHPLKLDVRAVDITVTGYLVWELASELLEVDEDIADELFDPGNDREDLQRIAEQIAENAGETL